jgi:hypothetical protein
MRTPGWLPRKRFAVSLAMAAIAGTPRTALAQTDEIQVYNGEIAAPGVLNLTLHNNYTPDGSKQPAFPGDVISNHSLNGVPEFAYGVTDWMEAGLYLPLYSIRGDGGAQLDGFKLRALFAVPHAAERTFFYAVNFEFSFNSKHWDLHTYTSEIRPIVGWRLGKIDVILNPNLDGAYEGLSRLDFAPESRVAYNVSKTWALAAEEYDDFGPLRHFYGHQQTHQLFGVVDWNGKPLNVEFGVGFGLNAASDRLTLKLILSRDL